MITNYLINIGTPMKLLLTSFVTSIISLFTQHFVVLAVFDQQSLLAWSATLTAVISGFCLAMIPVYQRIKQAKRDEEIKDSALCQAKLDETMVRIKALDLSVQELKNQSNELKEQSDRWERLYKAGTTQTLNKLNEINSGLKNE
jgi:hypothetical protein